MVFCGIPRKHKPRSDVPVFSHLQFRGEATGHELFHHVVRKHNRRADALANTALDKGEVHRWYKKGLISLFECIAAGTDDFFIQGRFDGAYRRKRGRSAIGTSLENVFSDGTSRPLFDLGLEVSSENSYEAELHAASRLVQETKHLYSKILIAAFPG